MPAELICGNFLDKIGGGVWDTSFADPPDNIGLKYANYKDSMDSSSYGRLMREWLKALLDCSNTVWLSFNSKWTIPMGSMVCELITDTDWIVRPCVQTFTFGQAQQRDLTNGYRPLWRFMRPYAKLHTDPVRIKSWRQQHGDKRAGAKGKVPDDTFDFPRVTGNSSQRRRWHPTQLHEGLVERCLRLTTPMGGTVLDPFAGTGTVLRVCQRVGFTSTSIEIDRTYCEQIAKENGMTISGGDGRWVM